MMMENKKGKWMKITLLICGILAVIFTIAMIIVFCIKGAVPDTLIVSVFAAIFGECSICGIIKKAKMSQTGSEEEGL